MGDVQDKLVTNWQRELDHVSRGFDAILAISLTSSMGRLLEDFPCRLP